MVDLREGTAARLDAALARAQVAGRLPSVVAGVVRGGGLVWSGAAGGLAGDPAPGVDVRYRIGSITKTFVAVLVMRLVEEGVVGLDDAVGSFVPDTPFPDRTVAQLLSHSGGLSAEPPGPWWERSEGVSGEVMRSRWSGAQVVGAAGDRHHYSNLGFAVLGELVSRCRGGVDWFEVLSDEVLAPLGMPDTSVSPGGSAVSGWAVHPFAEVVMPEVVQETGWMAPAGQLWSTVRDLSRWARFLLGDTGGVLSPETVARMRRPRVVVDGDAWVSGSGLGVQLQRVEGARLAGHGGSMPGFQAGLWVDEGAGVGVVRLWNCTTASPPDPGVLDLWRTFLECEPAEVVPWVPVESVPAGLLELTGQWFWGTSVGVLRVAGDGGLVLEAVSGMMPSSRFRRDEGGVWRGLDGYFAGEELRVVRAGGVVSHLDVGTFVLTRVPYPGGEVVPGGVARGWPVV
ncbi:CubicO group peptidase (beta-lactamase class C family) [Stackebrandtia albiflava]|uniref:CubicO group peptidase (Beta-lactamase class C family) n=1 Tax=Stackebrandtia albiflava TaxID=406432 RepID=A0A562VDB8_9ACTN|nr:serine hydrolase domain-containing protein [Stackebrandtia albiflava]TWJ15874.1 CubicO group peptidase (beta-lactamase class C family) [Stackebrandtia albiflava]